MLLRLDGLESAYQASLFLALAMAHLALTLTGEVHPAHVAVMALVLAGAALFFPRIAAAPAIAWNLLLAAVIAGSAATALAPPRDFETFFRGLTYFLIYTLTIRYFTRKGGRDDLVILLLSLLEVCAASIMTISLSFLFSLVLCLAIAVSALMLYSLRQEFLASRPAAAAAEPRPRPATLPPAFFAYSVSTAAAVFVLGLAIFFLIPRMSRSLFSWSTGIHTRVPGFSDAVEMGAVGRILRSDALVLRVRVEPPLDRGPLYLRGNALDRYDGRRWTDSASVNGIRYYRYDETVDLEGAATLPGGSKQEIVLEPIDSTVLFALPFARSVQAPFKFRGIVTYHNDYFGFPLATPIYDRILYTVWSVPPPSAEEACAETETTDPADRRYLQLPPGMEKIAALAGQAAGDEPSPCRRGLRLRDYLRDNYAYDLNTPSDQAPDPVADFLFNSRRGYCQHFASALVLMLRSQGIPARMGAGFLVEDFNAVDDYYLARENDAHTWAEMRAPSGQWVILDPTPAQAREENNTGAWKWAGDIFDSIRFRWDRWVVDLSLRDQVMMAMTVRRRGAVAGQGLLRLPGQAGALLRGILRQPLLWVPIAALLAYAAWTRRSSRRRAGPRAVRAGLVKEYARLLRQVAKKTRPRRESETLIEYGRALETRAPELAPPFAVATRAYLRVRFGRLPEEERALAAIRSARQQLRRRN